MWTSSPTSFIRPRRAIVISLAIVATTLLRACAPVYYPNISHAPLFSAAGETHASANVTTDGYELMGAVSPVEHIGVVGSYAWGKEMSIDAPPDDHLYGEAGICYYSPMEGTGTPRYQILGGYGRGSARSYEREISFTTHDPTYYLARSDYERAFIQGSMGSAFRTRLLNLWGETGGSIRVARVRLNTLRVGEAAYDGMMKTFFEPSIFVRLGHPIISAEFQFGYSFNLTPDAPFDYRSVYASLGAHIRIGAPEQEVKTSR